MNLALISLSQDLESDLSYAVWNRLSSIKCILPWEVAQELHSIDVFELNSDAHVSAGVKDVCQLPWTTFVADIQTISRKQIVHR